MQKLPGVANVETDASTRIATVSVEAGKFDAAKAVAALKNSGYAAKSAKAVESAAEAGADAPAEETSDAPAEESESTEANS